MPVLRINATEDGLQLHASATPYFEATRDHAAQAGPAVIMIHGYKYAPNDPTHCPHEKIFAVSDIGWPQTLGFSGAGSDEGLGIAFGWYARGPLWQAHRRAAKLGPQLAALIKTLRMSTPDRPIHVIAHSLGSEIALSALAHLEAGSVDKLLLLTGASFNSKARDMLATPAGLTTEVFNIISRENDLFDLAFEHMVPAPELGDRAIGQGIEAANVTTLQLDCDTTLRALTRLGLPVAPPQRRVCHWSSYTRPGVMAFYAELLRTSDRLMQERLARLLPASPTPRWSRFRVPAQTSRNARALLLPLAVIPLARKAKNRIMAATFAQGKDNEHAY